jgi:hypothetical protein
MAGEMGSFQRRITRSMTAGDKVVVAAGEECMLKRCQHGPTEKLRTTKRKAEAPAGDESQPKKCAIGMLGCSELDQGAAPRAKEEKAAGKKMTRLPQEEIDSILATVMNDERLPRDYRALKRHSPDLIPSPEEEMDEEIVSFYDLVREFYAVGEEFRGFQGWVRSEYTKNGYVEVDHEFLANRAKGKAIIEEARKEAIKCFDFSGLMD